MATKSEVSAINALSDRIALIEMQLASIAEMQSVLLGELKELRAQLPPAPPDPAEAHWQKWLALPEEKRQAILKSIGWGGVTKESILECRVKFAALPKEVRDAVLNPPAPPAPSAPSEFNGEF